VAFLFVFVEMARTWPSFDSFSFATISLTKPVPSSKAHNNLENPPGGRKKAKNMWWWLNVLNLAVMRVRLILPGT